MEFKRRIRTIGKLREKPRTVGKRRGDKKKQKNGIELIIITAK